MKTETVEIFQSIRALLQPFTTKGFTSRTSTEQFYDLWSDKQLDLDGNKIDTSVFASIEIKENKVQFCLIQETGDCKCSDINKLDDDVASDISVKLDIAYTQYKQKGWV